MLKTTLIACALALVTTQASARDTKLLLPIQDVLNSPDFQAKVGNDIKFYFAGQAAPRTAKSFGEFVTNKKSNGFGKSDDAACQWAMLSALIQLKERAVSEGANAVVDIVSYYKQNVFSSPAQYECHAGAVMAGVALKGTFVKTR
jgi:uncharacterized protein YbjQ (UPF0145 family)